MRPRKKKYTMARIESCSQVKIDPARDGVCWEAVFGRTAPLHIEIGSGKGGFILQSARLMPEIDFVAIERIPDVGVIALEAVRESGLKNVRVCINDAADLAALFGSGQASRIYLNFSDPWTKQKHAKRRLTAPGFLEIYNEILRPGGELHMKTDNKGLFEYSLKTLAQARFSLKNITFDLHKNEDSPYPITEYEKKFSEQGMAICRLEAVKT